MAILVRTRGPPIEPSLSLQIALYFNRYYSIFYFITNILVFVWKRNNFIFGSNAFGGEVTMLCFFLIIDLCRLELSTRGNKTRQINAMIWSAVLSVPILVSYSFFLRLQSYVLQLDVILNSIGITFNAFELILELFAIIVMYGLLPA